MQVYDDAYWPGYYEDIQPIQVSCFAKIGHTPHFHDQLQLKQANKEIHCVLKKYVPDIIGCIFSKQCTILIIFGIYIIWTLLRQPKAIHFLLHLVNVFALYLAKCTNREIAFLLNLLQCSFRTHIVHWPPGNIWNTHVPMTQRHSVKDDWAKGFTVGKGKFRPHLHNQRLQPITKNRHR